MDQPRPSAGAAGTVSRRGLLGAGLGWSGVLACSALGVGSVTGCTADDPRIDPTSHTATATSTRARTTAASSPSASATHSAQLAAAELALADLAGAILTGRHRRSLGHDREALLSYVRDAHRRHAAALASAEPTLRPSAPVPRSASKPPPGFGALSLHDALTTLRGWERAWQAQARGAALDSSGVTALLWGSISVAAGSYDPALAGDDAVRTAATDTAYRRVTPQSDVEAMQSVVRQLHALVYGYQLALGRMSEASGPGRRALGSLHAHRALRDALTLDLLARSASVPAAAGAYVPSVNPSSAHRSALLIRRMEVAFQPFCGLWLAAATRPADRRRALDTLAAAVTTARSWGGPVAVWPGWPG